MKKFLLISIAFFLVLFANAQTPVADSLKQVLAKEKEPLSQFDVTRRIANELITTGHPTFVPSYVHSLYGLAAQLGNDSLLMLSHNTMARYLDYKADSKEQLEYVLKALDIAQKNIHQHCLICMAPWLPPIMICAISVKPYNMLRKH